MKYTVTSIHLYMSSEQQVHVKMTIKYLPFFLFTYNITQSLNNHNCTLYTIDPTLSMLLNQARGQPNTH